MRGVHAGEEAGPPTISRFTLMHVPPWLPDVVERVVRREREAERSNNTYISSGRDNEDGVNHMRGAISARVMRCNYTEKARL